MAITITWDGYYPPSHPGGSWPVARRYAGCSYDSDQKVMIMHGGWEASGGAPGFNQTWAFDPSTKLFTNRSPTGAFYRWEPAQIYDPIGKRTMLFGGRTASSTSQNDLQSYSWSTNAWTVEISGGDPGSPGIRAAAAHCYDPVNHRMLVHGGISGAATYYSSLWALNLTTDTWSDLTSGMSGDTPSARYRHVMAYNQADGHVYLFGGQTDIPDVDYWDLYRINLSTLVCENITPTGGDQLAVSTTYPAARFLSIGSRLVLLGGLAQSASDRIYAYELDYTPGAEKWIEIGELPTPTGSNYDPPPYARFGHLGFWDPEGDQVFVGFGQSSSVSPVNSYDLWWGTSDDLYDSGQAGASGIEYLPRSGGKTVTVAGDFDTAKTYTVRIGPNADETDEPCYSGAIGNGYGVVSADGSSLTFISPPLPHGKKYLITASDGYTTQVIGDAIVLEDAFFTEVYELRKWWPRWYGTGPRRSEIEPRQDDTAAIEVDRPTLYLPLQSPGIANLEPGRALTINGATEYPVARYLGGQAAASGWGPWNGAGPNLFLAGSSNPPSYNTGSPFFGPDDDSVTFQGTGTIGDNVQCFLSALGDGVNARTKDIALHVIWRQPIWQGTANLGLYCKNAAGDTGYDLRTTTGGAIIFYLGNAGTHISVSGPYGYGPGEWIDIWVFINRNQADASGSRLFVNRTPGTGTNFSTINVDINPTGYFGFGAAISNNYAFNGSIALMELWLRDDWHLDSSAAVTEWQEIVDDSFYRTTGARALIANGTPAPDTFTRSLGARLEKEETEGTTLYCVGRDWPRISENSVGRGYLKEPPRTNLLLRSNAFDFWGLVGCTASANAGSAPDKLVWAYALVEDGSTGLHRANQTPTIVSSTPHAASIFVKAGIRTWCALESNAKYAYFQLAGDGSVGTTSGVIWTKIKRYRDDWYRIIIQFTSVGVSGTTVIYASDGDAGATYTGQNGQTALYVFGAQLEVGYEESSYIYTTTSQITRPVDRLTYVGNDGNVPQSPTYEIEADVIIRDASVYYANPIVCLTDGTASNKTWLYSKVGVGIAELGTAKSGGSAGVVSGTSDIADGELHTLRGTCDTDHLALYVDDEEEGTPDTDVDPFEGVTDIDVGTDEAGSAGMAALISHLKVF